MSRTYEVTVRVEATFTKTIEVEDYDDLNERIRELGDPDEVNSYDINWFDYANVEFVFGGPDEGEYSKGEKTGAFEEDIEEEPEDEDEEESEEKPTAE